MSYPRDPTTNVEALVTLADFARTAPGRLPTRVQEALKIADDYAETLPAKILAELRGETPPCQT
jgi:hypothetical protein